MNLYLSPNGRITQGTYWQGVIVLFVISAILAAASAFVSPLVGFAGILFIWPWIAVHVKRFHDAGKTGWLTIPMVILAMVASFVLGKFLPGLFGVDPAALQQEALEAVQSADPNDAGAIMSATMEATRKASQATMIPTILSTLLVTGIVGAVMGLFKSDPNANQYGPPAV